MSWQFLVWLIAFILQAALLGIVMYGIMNLSDLENDFINPHDASSAVNKWVMPEYAMQAAVTVLLLVTGNFAAGGAHAAILAYHVRYYLQGHRGLDVTEAFTQAPREKRIRIVKLVVYLLLFVLVIYRLVESILEGTLTQQGRQAAHHLLQGAAAQF